MIKRQWEKWKIQSIADDAKKELKSRGWSKEQIEKAEVEYRKYQEITWSPVEKAYMATIKDVNITAKREARKNRVKR